MGNLFDYPIGASIYINDAMFIFDDVFIPNERVFMKGEWPLVGDIAYMFGNFHRLSAETYKAAELEVVTGAAALMAEYNGIERTSHVQDKLTWLVSYAEATEVLGRAACKHCVSEPDSDLVYPNPMYANIAKFFFADNWHQATKYIQDIAGGIVATAPSSEDYFNPETHDMIDKYLGGKDSIPTEHRLRLIKLIRDLTSLATRMFLPSTLRVPWRHRSFLYTPWPILKSIRQQLREQPGLKTERNIPSLASYRSSQRKYSPIKVNDLIGLWKTKLKRRFKKYI